MKILLYIIYVIFCTIGEILLLCDGNFSTSNIILCAVIAILIPIMFLNPFE